MDSEEQAFLPGSGKLALELLNTARVEDGTHVEDLGSPEAVLRWLESARLLAPGSAGPLRSPPAARDLLTEARRLRASVAHVIEARLAGEVPPPFAVYGINRVLGASRSSTLLSLEEERPSLVELETAEGPLPVLVPIARAAANLLVATDPDRVRRCASEACTRWFVDTSKGGRRKWCSMATCGNRAKAARHRRRTA